MGAGDNRVGVMLCSCVQERRNIDCIGACGQRVHAAHMKVTTIRDGHTAHHDPNIFSDKFVQCFTHNVGGSNLRLQPALCGQKQNLVLQDSE
ncbi:hypothetical protein BDW22DRAFT_1361539 [Trametopsis cervina]|nr:hypothetical protein BDW22DRAFT_1361539 [Trametopsis cervina]